MVASFIYCLLTPARYTADTTIEIRGHAPILSTIQSETLFGNDTRKIEYQKTTVAKLRLEGLADQVLQDSDLAQELERYWSTSHGFGSNLVRYVKALSPEVSNATSLTSGAANDHFSHARKIIQRYLNLIDIEPIHETNLVHIRATTTNRRLSQRVANAHAIQFIEHLRRERQESIEANVQLLQAQASDLKERVTQAEAQLNSFATQHKLLITRSSEPNSLNNRHIDSLTQMLADATGRRIKSESSLTHAKKNREDQGSFLDTEIVHNLRAQLKQAETEYATLGSQVTAAYPGMRELQAKMVSLKKAIAEERGQGIQNLQRQYDADLGAENNLREQISLEKSRAQEVAALMIQYDVLSKEASSLRELYQAVLKQAKEVEMSAATTTSNVFIADYAGLPLSPSAPKTKMIVIIISFVGLVSGLIAAYMKELLSDTLGSTEDIQRALDLPIIGSVPTFENAPTGMQKLRGSLRAIPRGQELSSPQDNSIARSATPGSSIVTLSAPHSIISEALRTIRANVLLSSADYPPRIIMVTSSIQGEGKTTIVGNVAVTLAQANHRTLMIDGDLRIGGLSTLFAQPETENRPGLSDLLARHTSLEEAIHRTTVPNLDLLPSGSKAPNPAELVGSETMKRLLAGLKERYDFILVDTPPVMAVADSLLLSRMVDSVLFVVRSSVTPRGMAREAREKLAHVRARIIGVVCNDVPSSSHIQEALRYGANYFEGETAA